MSIVNAERAPAQPSYILRGYSAPIHALHFLRSNSRLLTGDADGWVVLWSTPTRRAVAVWRAHPKTILGVGSWDDDKILTHGRNNKLHVWQLREEDEANMSTVLPIDGTSTERRQPWLLHSFDVNALNFCAFATCVNLLGDSVEKSSGSQGILVATPGVDDGCINVTSLPEEQRIVTVPPVRKEINTGMVMAIGLHPMSTSELLVLAGYESGHTAIWQCETSTRDCKLVYLHKSHTQPILSLSIAVGLESFYTSSADAIVARHPLSKSSSEPKLAQTKHAGQQSLTIRNDEKVFATAGWDSRVRVYSTKTMNELAVLKWHKDGCYAVAFADVNIKTTLKANNELNAQDDTNSLVLRQLTVAEKRTEKTKATHWLAVGSKDGKVSLWDIY